jgi:ligand-binding sensor protein
MELTDLLPIREWEALENEIHERSGLSTSIFNIDGIRITDNMKWPNRLCPEIKADPKGQSFICATAHMNIALQAKESCQGVLEGCDAGLVKLVVPILVNDTYLGAVGACGLLLDDEAVDDFLIDKTTDLKEAEIQELCNGIPSISTPQAQALITFIQERLDRIIASYRTRCAGR